MQNKTDEKHPQSVLTLLQHQPSLTRHCSILRVPSDQTLTTLTTVTVVAINQLLLSH